MDIGVLVLIVGAVVTRDVRLSAESMLRLARHPQARSQGLLPAHFPWCDASIIRWTPQHFPLPVATPQGRRSA